MVVVVVVVMIVIMMVVMVIVVVIMVMVMVILGHRHRLLVSDIVGLLLRSSSAQQTALGVRNRVQQFGERVGRLERRAGLVDRGRRGGRLKDRQQEQAPRPRRAGR